MSAVKRRDRYLGVPGVVRIIGSERQAPERNHVCPCIELFWFRTDRTEAVRLRGCLVPGTFFKFLELFSI